MMPQMFIVRVRDESWAQGLRQSQPDIQNAWWWYSITYYILSEFPASFLKTETNIWPDKLDFRLVCLGDI